MWDFKRFSNNVAAIDDKGKQISYEQLLAENSKTAYVLSRRCLIFIFCTNSIGALAAYVNCINNRAVPLLLAKNLDGELRGRLIEKYKPDYLWVPEDMEKEFAAYASRYNAFGYTLLETGYKNIYSLYRELCLLLTTSGSTGSPKLVRQSYRNVLSNAESIAQYLELDSTERPITTLPMNYTYGLSIINSHLLVGATILFTEKGLLQKDFWTFFKDARATSFGGVPYTYEMLDRLNFLKMELPSLRTMTQAGGKLQPELHKKFAEYALEKKKRFFVMYGQAEATARMSYLPYQKSLEKYGSMGIAIPGGKFSLIDTAGKEIHETNMTGELIYEGPNVTLGYAECGEELMKADERRGRLETGDMARMDEDGYFYIVGRKKRFLKIFGNRVNLDEIDRLVKAHFEEIDCASSGRDDNLYVFLTRDGMENKIRQFLSEKTRLNPASFTIMAIPVIPRNESGKILYNELAQYIEG